MKNWVFFLGCIAAYGQQVTISDTLTNSVGGGAWTGRITIALNSPSSASPLYYSTTSLAGWQYVLCVGVTGSDCSATTAAGVVTVPLYANSTITPAGTSYNARYAPTKGSPTTETWTVTASSTKLYQIRATTVPTPTTTFQASQIVPGSNGQVLTTTAGASAWGSVPACATCVVTSGSYADPAWLTSLAGSKVSGNIAGNAGTATALSANGTNCAAGTFPLGVDASGNSESCTALPTTISGTANQITASASTGAVTLSLPATITGLTSVTSTSFTGALTGNASTATALASTVASGRLWIGQGTGVPTSSANLIWDTANDRLGVGIGSPRVGARVDIAGGFLYMAAGSQIQITGNPGTAGFQIVGNDAATSTIGTMTAYDLGIRTNSTTRVTVNGSSGNLIVGGTYATDLGYGLHAANKGTNGNLLVFDPTATTGTTKAVFTAGQGQSGNILEVRGYNAAPGSGTLLASVSGSGYGVFAGLASTGSTLSLAKLALGYASYADLRLSSDAYIGFNSATNITGTQDLSLSRASAGVLQVGDGGANANGKIAAAVGLFGGAADAGFKLHVNATAAYTGDTAGAFILTDSATPAKRLYMGYDASADVGFINSVYSGVANKPLALNAAGGNVLIGTVTDLGYGLHASKKGTNGNLLVYDPTATTGNTKEVIRAGAGQSTNLTEWQNNAGTVLGFVRASDGLLGSTILSTADIQTAALSNSGNSYTAGLNLKSAGGIGWSSTGNWFDTKDTGLARNAAGVLEVNNGTAGTYRDLRVRSVFITQSTPAASTDACTAGALWADASYVYACTSSGVIKRATLATF